MIEKFNKLHLTIWLNWRKSRRCCWNDGYRYREWPLWWIHNYWYIPVHDWMRWVHHSLLKLKEKYISRLGTNKGGTSIGGGAIIREKMTIKV